MGWFYMLTILITYDANRHPDQNDLGFLRCQAGQIVRPDTQRSAQQRRERSVHSFPQRRSCKII